MSALRSGIAAGPQGGPPARIVGRIEPATKARPVRVDAAARAARPRVLVVDDEIENLELVRRYLQRHFTVDITTSAARALQMLEQQAYDIIITDQRMPEMTGSRLLAEARRLAPRAVRFVITAYSDPDATVEAINLGKVSGYIQKPFAAQTLLDAIWDELNELPAPEPIREANEPAGAETTSVVPGEDARRAGPTAPAHTDPASAAPAPEVLVVDGSPLMVRSLRRLLGRRVQVRCAGSLTEASDLLERFPHTGLVVTSAALPDGSAWDLQRRAARLCPSLVDHFVTMTDDEGDPAPGTPLCKPFVPRDFYAAVGQHLAHAHP